MPQSLSKLYVHLIFRIKNMEVFIRDADRYPLYAYMESIIRNNGCMPVIVNGTNDHVHILCIMSKSISLAKLAEEIKRHSSRWIKKCSPHYKGFAWQPGYTGFSVSQSMQEKTKKYIRYQAIYHERYTFHEELMVLLSAHQIHCDNKKLFLN